MNMKGIVQAVLERLKDLGLEVRLKNNQLTLKSHKGETQYDLEAKSYLSLASLSVTLSHLKKHPAHPLLIRAELLALGDERLREVADKLLKDGHVG